MSLKVVYDTNVIVSAIWKPGSIPAFLVELALNKQVRLFYSPPILQSQRECARLFSVPVIYSSPFDSSQQTTGGELYSGNASSSSRLTGQTSGLPPLIASQQGAAVWEAVGTILRGWALAMQGQVREGIAQLRQGLTAYRATGTQAELPHYLTLLAEACQEAEQIEEGLAALAEALEVVDKAGERFYEAELYRLKGELLLNAERGIQNAECSPQAEAEERFHQAIDIARNQGAKSLELRAVMSLSRLWRQQGKKKQARQMLAEICNWFTEGFDTADLREAKALLED